MAISGLRYGEEFRPIRELAAGAGRSSGRVALSEAIAKRAAEYPLHPVLFDGALQVFSAGAATVEDRKAQMKLPVRFARILFLRCPGAASLVRASVLQCNERVRRRAHRLYDEAGQPCVLVDGFRAISVSGARRSSAPGEPRSCSTMSTGSARRPRRPPAERCRRRRLERLRAAAQRDPRTRCSRCAVAAALQAAMAAGDELAAAQIARGLREMARIGRGDRRVHGGFAADRAAMRPVFERLMAKLGDARFFLKAGRLATVPPALFHDGGGRRARRRCGASSRQHPGHLPEGLLCAANCAELGPILRGEKDAVQVLFAGAGAELLDQFYGEGLYTSHWLAAIAARGAGGRARACRKGAGCASWKSARAPAASPRTCCRCSSAGCTPTPSPMSRPASSPSAAQKLAAFPKWSSRCSILRSRRRSRASSRALTISSSAPTCCTRWPTCAPRWASARPARAGRHPRLHGCGHARSSGPRSVFGLTSGWWRFTDRDLRPEHPLLAARAVGSSSCAEPALPRPRRCRACSGRKAKARSACSRGKPRRRSRRLERRAARRAGRSNRGCFLRMPPAWRDALASRLRAAGARCRIVRRGERLRRRMATTSPCAPEAREDWDAALAGLRGRRAAGALSSISGASTNRTADAKARPR